MYVLITNPGFHNSSLLPLLPLFPSLTSVQIRLRALASLREKRKASAPLLIARHSAKKCLDSFGDEVALSF